MNSKSKWVVVARDANNKKVASVECVERRYARAVASWWSEEGGAAIARVSRRKIEAWTDMLGHQHKHTYNDLLERWVNGVKVWDYQSEFNATHKRVGGKWVKK